MWRSTTAANYSQIAALGPSDPRATQTRADDGTKYYYEVSACDAAAGDAYNANGAQSAVTVLAAPTLLAANAISSSQINLNWQNNSGSETNSCIERSPSGQNQWTQLYEVGPTDQNISDTSVLADGTAYDYRVRAYNSANGAYSQPTRTWPPPSRT